MHPMHEPPPGHMLSSMHSEPAAQPPSLDESDGPELSAGAVVVSPTPLLLLLSAGALVEVSPEVVVGSTVVAETVVSAAVPFSSSAGHASMNVNEATGIHRRVCIR